MDASVDNLLKVSSFLSSSVSTFLTGGTESEMLPKAHVLKAWSRALGHLGIEVKSSGRKLVTRAEAILWKGCGDSGLFFCFFWAMVREPSSVVHFHNDVLPYP